MAFNVIGDLQTRLASTLQRPTWAALIADRPDWADIATDALENAYQFIAATLGGRGFSAAQISDWDYGEKFEIDLALYFALRDGGALNNYDSKFIEMLDRRDELAGTRDKPAMAIMISGQPVRPLGASPPISFGYMDDTRGSFKRSVSSSGTVTTHDW